jgi:hypothetical protein
MKTVFRRDLIRRCFSGCCIKDFITFTQNRKGSAKLGGGLLRAFVSETVTPNRETEAAACQGVKYAVTGVTSIFYFFLREKENMYIL